MTSNELWQPLRWSKAVSFCLSSFSFGSVCCEVRHRWFHCQPWLHFWSNTSILLSQFRFFLWWRFLFVSLWTHHLVFFISCRAQNRLWSHSFLLLAIISCSYIRGQIVRVLNPYCSLVLTVVLDNDSTLIAAHTLWRASLDATRWWFVIWVSTCHSCLTSVMLDFVISY